MAQQDGNDGNANAGNVPPPVIPPPPAPAPVNPPARPLIAAQFNVIPPANGGRAAGAGGAGTLSLCGITMYMANNQQIVQSCELNVFDNNDITIGLNHQQSMVFDGDEKRVYRVFKIHNDQDFIDSCAFLTLNPADTIGQLVVAIAWILGKECPIDKLRNRNFGDIRICEVAKPILVSTKFKACCGYGLLNAYFGLICKGQDNMQERTMARFNKKMIRGYQIFSEYFTFPDAAPPTMQNVHGMKSLKQIFAASKIIDEIGHRLLTKSLIYPRTDYEGCIRSLLSNFLYARSSNFKFIMQVIRFAKIFLFPYVPPKLQDEMLETVELMKELEKDKYDNRFIGFHDVRPIQLQKLNSQVCIIYLGYLLMSGGQEVNASNLNQRRKGIPDKLCSDIERVAKFMLDQPPKNPALKKDASTQLSSKINFGKRSRDEIGDEYPQQDPNRGRPPPAPAPMGLLNGEFSDDDI